MITVTVNKDDSGITWNTDQLYVCIPLYCKYREVFSIVNSGLSINHDAKMAVSLSPSTNFKIRTSLLKSLTKHPLFIAS